jgi:hypothetical protein
MDYGWSTRSILSRCIPFCVVPGSGLMSPNLCITSILFYIFFLLPKKKKKSKGRCHHTNNSIKTFTTFFFSHNIDKYLTLSNKLGIDFALLLKILSFLSCQITQIIAIFYTRIVVCYSSICINKIMK